MNSNIHLDKFLSPRSVAIIGASPQRGSPRNTLVRNLVKHGFGGRIYPVSPSHSEIEGIAAFKSVRDLPETPDVALVITPADTVPGVVAECGRSGIHNVIVFSAGFEEIGDAGKAIAQRLAEAARDHGVAVLGPNCNGVWSVRRKTMLTFSPAALNLDLIPHAPIAIVSQSGALAGAMANALQGGGLGCSYVVSVGNETCLDALDGLACVVEQDDVRAVVLYIEGLDDASRILPIAERARERGIQIVVLKAGRSAVGQQATASHTGKIASSHAVYADVLQQAGILSVNSLQDAIAALEVLSSLPDPRVSGDAQGGVSVLSSSGGAGALLADHSSDFGVPMTEFSPDIAHQLEKMLPGFARKANPIDLTGQVNTDRDLFGRTCEVVSSDPRTEAIVVQFASSGRRYLVENADLFKRMAQDLLVVVSFVGETMDREVRKDFRDAGVLLSSDPSATMQAIAWLYQRRRWLDLPRLVKREPPAPRKVPSDWAGTMQLLEQSGLTPAPWLVLGPGDSATSACAALQYPLVVKVLPSESEHKTELGLVKLRVRTADDVDAIAAEFRSKLGKPAAGILVQEMVGDGVEVVISCLRGTDFGPILSIGTGGVAIELDRDIANLALPVTRDQVLASLRRLKLWVRLQGFRGKPAADVDALADAAVRFGDMFLACADAMEFEVNPVIVRLAGQGLAAVDALITVNMQR